jgi:hypothetical protein
MSTRIVRGGKTIWASRDFRLPRRVEGPARDRDGIPVDVVRAIPADSARSIFREGVPLSDDNEGITYQVLGRCDPLQGWATTAFWQDRWRIKHGDLVKFVSLGYLDAAIEAGSQIRRFRCRDENRLKLSKEWHVVRKRMRSKS